MKLICERQLLCDAVQNVSYAVSQKSSLLSLEGILMKARDNRLHLTGYDLELGISTTIEAKVLEEGEVVLSSKLLSDIIRRMPSDEISITTDAKNLAEIKGGVSEFTILGIAASEFPELPVIAGTASLALPQTVIKSMIAQTHFAIALSDSKPVHTGALFDLEEETLSIVAVDGYRMALRKETVQGQKALSFIVPGKTLAELLKLLKDDDTVVEMQLSKKHIIFEVNGYSMVSRLLEGEFLDYKSAIPKQKTTSVEVGTRPFVDSIERTSLLISDRLKSPLKLTFEKERIVMSCSTPIGKAHDETVCQFDGTPVEIGFNNKYLLDALKASECDKVKLEIGGALSPMKVVPCEGESFLFLVLPVKLKNE